MFKDEDEQFFALTYRIKTYYAANATGVVNSVFVFLSSDFPKTQITNLIQFVFQNTAQAVGTSDFLIIMDHKKMDKESAVASNGGNARLFHFGLCDLLLDPSPGRLSEDEIAK